MSWRDFFSHTPSEHHFGLFSITHIIAILIVASAMFLVYKFRVEIRNWRFEKVLRYGLPCLTLFFEFTQYFWHITHGDTWQQTVPWALCGFCIYFFSYGLLFNNSRVFKTAYFWFFGAILSFIYFDTPHWIDRYRFYAYAVCHFGILVMMVYGTFVMEWKPTRKDFNTSTIVLLSISVFTAIYNNFIDSSGNFLYLYNSPVPPITKAFENMRYVYVVLFMAFAYGCMWLTYLPFYLKERKEKK